MPAAPAPPPPTFDPAAAYPELHQLRVALTARDWAGVRAVVDAAPEPAARTMLIRTTSEREGLEPFLRDVLARDPDDAVAGCMLGAHLIHTGWEVLGPDAAESRAGYAEGWPPVLQRFVELVAT